MNKFPEIKGKTIVSRKIDGVYIVWFQNGNQYLRMEEPAFFVFQNLERGILRKQIAVKCIQKYHNSEEESIRFINEIASGIDSIRQSPVLEEIKDLKRTEIPKNTYVPYSIHQYFINGKYIYFYFETPFYEYFLHPLLQHLEAEDSSPDSAVFEIFEYQKDIVLRVDQQVKGIWSIEETHLLKGMIFLQILNIIYDKREEDWMAVIHASAVTNNKKTIVFTAGPGSGKSTIAALLQNEGFQLVSDDFVPIDISSLHAFPFPAAMSIKEGAIGILAGLYPSLQKKETQWNLSNKMVKYLSVNKKVLSAPVKEIIFIKYDPTTNIEIKKLAPADALKMLLDETWTFPSAKNAGRFLDWYSELSCYHIRYSDNGKAIRVITKLFKNGQH
jgi:hypothetical protein